MRFSYSSSFLLSKVALIFFSSSLFLLLEILLFSASKSFIVLAFFSKEDLKSSKIRYFLFSKIAVVSEFKILFLMCLPEKSFDNFTNSSSSISDKPFLLVSNGTFDGIDFVIINFLCFSSGNSNFRCLKILDSKALS